MFVSNKALNGRHLTTAFCRRGAERKRRRLAEEEAQAGAEAAFTAYGIPLAPVTSTRYLRRVLLADDNNCPVVVCNLQTAHQKWARLTRVLSREGADGRTLGQIYLAVLQLVLLYVSETWAMTPHNRRVLGRFHHRVDHRLTVRQPRRGTDGVWIYPLLEDAVAEAGLQEVDTYVSFCQDTVAQFIATRNIMDLCLESERRLGSRISKRWW